MATKNDTEQKAITVADLLDEYGSALRGSWGDIDGRSEQMSLWHLSDLIRKYGNAALSGEEVDEARENLGVCPYGGRHWTYFCDDTCADPEGE